MLPKKSQYANDCHGMTQRSNIVLDLLLCKFATDKFAFYDSLSMSGVVADMLEQNSRAFYDIYNDIHRLKTIDKTPARSSFQFSHRKP